MMPSGHIHQNAAAVNERPRKYATGTTMYRKAGSSYACMTLEASSIAAGT